MARICNLCPKELPDGARSETCSTCRSYLRYWVDRKPVERLERKARIGTWIDRLDTFGDKSKGGKK